jgi:hypothetical protein
VGNSKSNFFFLVDMHLTIYFWGKVKTFYEIQFEDRRQECSLEMMKEERKWV